MRESRPRSHRTSATPTRWEIDWADVLPPDECSYVFSNPPFGGSKFQSPEQRAQVRRVAALGGSGTLDYVAAWFIRAGDYVRQTQPTGGAPPRIGFVATNSVTQGEQVAQLWPLLLDHRRLEITFAHRTFAWGSDARGKAHVHVVIITSAMHMAWMRAVTGRLESRYMYSVGVVYNTFPLPPGFENADTSALEPLAQDVLDARAEHRDATLSELYDPDLMPPNLRKAHQALDRAVDRLYRRKRFTSKRERVEYLFALYERMQAPLAAAAAEPKKRRRRRA